jgi:hypothetical protein
MYLIPIAWLYVALMMAVAEASNTTGTLLGALITFVFYGVGPVALLMYLLGWPARRRALKAQETAQRPSLQPDAGSHATGDATVAPVRKEP